MKTQTQEEKVQIIRDYFRNDFARCHPMLEPIFDADGNILCKPSYLILAEAMKDIGFLRKDIINEIILNLSLNDLLVKKPPVVERIVEVEKKPDPKVEKKKAFEAAHNAGLRNKPSDNRTELDDEWNHGKTRPVLTEDEKAVINTRNSRINEIVTETLSTIENYSAHTHSRTYSRRAELRDLFNKWKNQIVDPESAEKLQRTIAERIDSFDRSTSGSVR